MKSAEIKNVSLKMSLSRPLLENDVDPPPQAEEMPLPRAWTMIRPIRSAERNICITRSIVFIF
jgi:hypothetical protein